MEHDTHWIDIGTLSRIKGVTTREVTSKGGKSYEILLSSIEPELQEKYLNYHIKEVIENNGSTKLDPHHKGLKFIFFVSATIYVREGDYFFKSLVQIK